MRRPHRLLAGVAVAACLVLAGGALGLIAPRSLAGASGWSAVVLATLFGYGALGRRALERGAATIDLGPGEQLAVGTIVWIAMTGVLLAVGVASRVPLLVLAGAGVGLAIHDLVARARAAGDTGARWSPAVVALVAVLGIYLVATVVGWVSSRGNPYDDHVAYTGLVKRVLDCGDLVEPFSFRRLSAYGGQTMLLALAGARGDVESIDLLDRGIFHGIAVLLVIDVIRRRKLNFAAGALIVFFMLSLWDLALNCASVWTGFTLFGAAYAFATREDLSPRAALILAFAACGAACTLRQNYLAPAGLFAALLLLGHVREHAAKRTGPARWRAAIREQRTLIVVAIGAAASVLVPYMIAAWISNDTFLYPILLGTGNPIAPLQPAAHTWLGELSFFFDVAFSPEPIRIWWLFVPAMVIAKDVRRLRPFAMYAISCAFGFAFLIHSFTLSDASQLWRYGFGYMSPLAIMFLIEISARLPFLEPASPVTLRVPSIAALLVWFAVLAQLFETRNVVAHKLAAMTENIAAGLALGSDKEIELKRRAHADLQASLPEGASIALLVDSPYLLDFARNRLVALDIPGYAAPAPGLPSFRGPEALRAYLLAQGLRYVAFVDNDHSTYLYRRAGWVHRMFRDGEIWQFIAAHMVDIEDSLVALATTSKVMFHRDALYAIDLGAAVPPAPTSRVPIEEMYAFIRRIAETELDNNAWQIASRSDVVFVPDGAGPSDVHLEVVPRPRIPTHGLFDRIVAPLTAPHRWLVDRTHVRVRGAARQHIKVELELDLNKLYTRPSVTLTLDGHHLVTAIADPTGKVTLEADAACRGWCDVYLTVSTMSEWWASADGLQAIKLRAFDWAETR